MRDAQAATATVIDRPAIAGVSVGGDRAVLVSDRVHVDGVWVEGVRVEGVRVLDPATLVDAGRDISERLD